MGMVNYGLGGMHIYSAIVYPHAAVHVHELKETAVEPQSA